MGKYNYALEISYNNDSMMFEIRAIHNGKKDNLPTATFLFKYDAIKFCQLRGEDLKFINFETIDVSGREG